MKTLIGQSEVIEDLIALQNDVIPYNYKLMHCTLGRLLALQGLFNFRNRGTERSKYVSPLIYMSKVGIKMIGLQQDVMPHTKILNARHT